MKITINKQFLTESIQHVNKAVSSRTTIPILSGIKIDVNERGMTLTSSNTDISIQSFIPTEKDGEDVIKLEQGGSIVAPAKFFVDIVRKLPTNEVFLEVNASLQITIRSGSAEIQLAGLDPEEFPTLPTLTEEQTVSLPSEVLKSMIRQTVFAVSSNEATPVLTGVLWSLNNQTLKFVATDRHRLASIGKTIDCPPDLSFNNIVISGKNLNELSKILPEQNLLVDIVVAENQVLFRMENVLFFSRILDGTYPDTSKFIPQVYKSEIVSPVKPLSDAIERAYLLSREEKTNIVRITTTDESNFVEVSSNSTELGSVTELIEVEELVGETLRISFNSKYMLDVLKVTDGETIRIVFTGAMSPMILKPTGDSVVLHLMTPYRTYG